MWVNSVALLFLLIQPHYKGPAYNHVREPFQFICLIWKKYAELAGGPFVPKSYRCEQVSLIFDLSWPYCHANICLRRYWRTGEVKWKLFSSDFRGFSLLIWVGAVWEENDSDFTCVRKESDISVFFRICLEQLWLSRAAVLPNCGCWLSSSAVTCYHLLIKMKLRPLTSHIHLAFIGVIRKVGDDKQEESWRMFDATLVQNDVSWLMFGT